MINLTETNLEELKQGYRFDPNKGYTCLQCHKTFSPGEVFPMDGRLFEASKAVEIHVRRDHGDRLHTLTAMDRKYTGLTDTQRELLVLMAQGLSDKEIAEKTGVASATIRHQRFSFREKAKQAKLYLAIFELTGEMAESKSRSGGDDLVSIHTGATMVDERYATTASEEEKILSSAFESFSPLKLKVFPAREKRKIVVLRRLVQAFEAGRKYTEKEVNAVLKAIFDDYATLRRYMIEYGFMGRTQDCREYWLK